MLGRDCDGCVKYNIRPAKFKSFLIQLADLVDIRREVVFRYTVRRDGRYVSAGTPSGGRSIRKVGRSREGVANAGPIQTT